MDHAISPSRECAEEANVSGIVAISTPSHLADWHLLASINLHFGSAETMEWNNRTTELGAFPEMQAKWRAVR